MTQPAAAGRRAGTPHPQHPHIPMAAAVTDTRRAITSLTNTTAAHPYVPHFHTTHYKTTRGTSSRHTRGHRRRRQKRRRGVERGGAAFGRSSRRGGRRRLRPRGGVYPVMGVVVGDRRGWAVGLGEESHPERRAGGWRGIFGSDLLASIYLPAHMVMG
jgi:hypothetical protein